MPPAPPPVQPPVEPVKSQSKPRRTPRPAKAKVKFWLFQKDGKSSGPYDRRDQAEELRAALGKGKILEGKDISEVSEQYRALLKPNMVDW